MDSTEHGSGGLVPLEESLCSDPDIVFAVVFGSRTGGEPRRSSDLDVAVEFSAELSPHERFQKRCFLSGDLQRDDAPFVDLSDIEHLPIEVAHEAVQGTLLCGDEERFQRVKTAIESEFEDRRTAIRRHQRDVIDRIAEEGLGG